MYIMCEVYCIVFDTIIMEYTLYTTIVTICTNSIILITLE